MPASRSWLAVTALAALLPGCRSTPTVERGATVPAPPGTVLVLQGSAFAAPAARDEAVALVRGQSDRPVHLVADEPPVERVVQAAASDGDRRFATAARAESRSAGCRKKGRSVATAVAERADTILRVRVDAKTTSRPATDADRATLREPGLAGMLSAVGIGRDDVVYETTLEGSVERTTFPGATTVARESVRAVDRRLGRRDEPSTPSVHDALARALGALPPPAPSRWDAVARSLVTGGCPVLATAVADAFLDDTAARRRIRAAAASALAASSAKRDTVSAPSPDIATAVPDAESSPVPGGDPPPSPPEPAYTCTQLCSLHMVEICNNDRTLWSQHGSRWESTRCGVRRNEAFLSDCYRMQWLSGTYEQSCLHPCEQTVEGRTRLTAMLRRSGCLRAGS
jgi:hypothetical protein